MRRFCLMILLLSGGCGSGETDAPAITHPPDLSAAERDAMQSARIFFGHQSVGSNILEGIREFAPGLKIVTPGDSSALTGPALIESSIGHNGDPRSKDRAFLSAIPGLGPHVVATYKYCYADMLAGTDPDSLFAAYQSTLDAAARLGIRTMAITMPLTTVAPVWKRGIKRLVGRTTDFELNARRQRFNELLRGADGDRPLIDLARMESTLENGQPQRASSAGQTVEILAPGYTDDGAHLNDRGRRHVTPLFLQALAAAIIAGD